MVTADNIRHGCRIGLPIQQTPEATSARLYGLSVVRYDGIIRMYGIDPSRPSLA